MEHEIPYLYLFIYSKLKNKAWNDSYLTTKSVLDTIKHECNPVNMPHNLLYHVLTQMEDYGLIKRIHRLKYKLIDKNIPQQFFNMKDKNNMKDDFQKSIASINKLGKIKCEDDSLYKILPSKELKKLNQLNCWFVKS